MSTSLLDMANAECDRLRERLATAEADAQGGREYHETYCQEADKATQAALADAAALREQLAGAQRLTLSERAYFVKQLGDRNGAYHRLVDEFVCAESRATSAEEREKPTFNGPWPPSRPSPPPKPSPSRTGKPGPRLNASLPMGGRLHALSPSNESPQRPRWTSYNAA